MVRRIAVEKLEERPPSLTGTVEERGTDLATVFTPGLETRRDALLSDDPAFTLEALQARLRLIFEELQKAWAAQDLSGVRPYVSAGLYQYLDYWVSAYRTQGLRNEVEGATLEKSELVRVVRDACYDSLTFRIWGSGRDFTVRVTTGEVVGGEPDEGPEVHRVLDPDPRSQGPRCAPGRPGLPRLRRRREGRHGGKLRLLRGARDLRRLRLGPRPDRAGRLVHGIAEEERSAT